jgi:hypothetical protein
MSKPVSTESAARSVQGPQGGLAQATSTTAVTFNLTAWAGQWVRLTVEGANHYFLCAAATGDSITAADTAASAAAPDVNIPDYLPDGGSDQFLVDLAYPFLVVETKSGTGIARVRRC